MERASGVREFPSSDPPVISVGVGLRGASADVVQSQITEPLEDAINGIAGIRTLTSSSGDGRASLRVEFELGSDLEAAANDVRDRVNGALNQLPPDIDPPEVSKDDADSQTLIMLWVKSSSRNMVELSRLTDELLVERLQTIPGISRVDIWGEKKPAMRIWLDPQRLAAYRLSPLDVRNAIQRENVELPSGRIEGQSVQLAVRTLSRLNTPDEFEDLVLKSVDGRVVRLGDVGRAELQAKNLNTIMRVEGDPMVAAVVRTQPGANFLDISNEFYERIDRIRPTLPPDITIGYGFDTTHHIRRSIEEVEQTIFLALALVIVVIFAFLREWRTTLIPVLAIPVSLIGSFAVMWAAGFSINVLTLLALVLAIGLVVDDAIVVLENIYAKVEAGQRPIEAAVAGTREIFFAVDRDHRGADRGAAPAPLPRRSHRAPVPRVRSDAGGSGRDLGAGGAHAHADAVEPPAQEARQPDAPLPLDRAVLPADDRRLSRQPHPVPGTALAGVADRPRLRRADRRDRARVAIGARPDRGPQHHAAPGGGSRGRHLPVHRRVHAEARRHGA